MTAKGPEKQEPVTTRLSIIEQAAALYAQSTGVLDTQASVPTPSAMPAPHPRQTEPRAPLITPVEVFQPEARQRAPEGPVSPIDLERLRQRGYLVPGSPPTPLSEAFRVAKRHVLLNAFGGRATVAAERGRAIIVSSANPNEGKTFCSINLALSLASEQDVEVLLVDADSIKPEILSNLGVSGSGGLMDALASGENPERYVVQTSISNFSILPAGQRTHNDTELLASRQMRDFIDGYLAAAPARLILFDSAPVLAASSAPALAAQAGQVVLVVRADETDEAELAQAVQLFGGGTRLQLLLNRARFQRSSQKYGAYYGYGG